MTRFVIDASVAVKWVVTEDGTPEAITLLSANSLLAAPELLIAECSNILWKKVRLAELSEQEAMLAAGLLQCGRIELHPSRDLLEPATRLAIHLDHAAYDCIHIALAEKHGWQFVITDSRLLEKVRHSSLSCRNVVCSLKEAADSIEAQQ